MAVNYDAPRTRETEELETDSLEGLQAASAEKEIDDTDDGEIVEPFELSLIHISEPTRRLRGSRMPSSA